MDETLDRRRGLTVRLDYDDECRVSGGSVIATYEDERLAIATRYVASSQELELTLNDGSRHLIPVDRLEMVESAPDAFVPIARPSDEQLSNVKVRGGGSAIY